MAGGSASNGKMRGEGPHMEQYRNNYCRRGRQLPGAQARQGGRCKGAWQGSGDSQSCLSSDSDQSKEWQRRGSCSSGSRSGGDGIGTSRWSDRSGVAFKISIFAKFAPKGPHKCPYFSARKQKNQNSSRTFSVLRLDWTKSRQNCSSY